MKSPNPQLLDRLCVYLAAGENRGAILKRMRRAPENQRRELADLALAFGLGALDADAWTICSAPPSTRF